LYTTEPVAQQAARKAAGEELIKFTNVFRAEVGKDQYTDAAADRGLRFGESTQEIFGAGSACAWNRCAEEATLHYEQVEVVR
jgi:hypothetical protein